MDDPRIPKFIEIAEKLKQGEFSLDGLQEGLNPEDSVDRLGLALIDLAKALQHQYHELLKLDQITTGINAGLMLEEILERVYSEFREVIPYRRIGFALLSEDGSELSMYWVKSDLPVMRLGKGYHAAMEGSSLQAILATGRARIINDLVDYLKHKPGSESTRLMVEEGIRSSLTCPLIANGVPVGFIFFSSDQANIYSKVHIEIYQRIANQLSVILEKGRLVTELAVQKAEIQKQNEELVRLNELRNAFLGMAVHDLRSPLSTVQMGMDVLLDPNLALSEKDSRRFLEDIRQQTDDMLELITDLLSVSQFESGTLHLDFAEIDLMEMLEQAVERHNTLAESKGTCVLLTGTPSGVCTGDYRHLRQVLDNLISNAVKFSPAKSTVRVKLEQTPRAWKVSVEDEGPGITDKDREQMFTYFARLSAQPTGGEKSTGLGLAICKRVIDAHGGEISVDNNPGRGATFWFTLPCS